MRVFFPGFRLLACTVAAPILLSGCFSPGGHESRGVNLSEAMNSASKGGGKDLGGGSGSILGGDFSVEADTQQRSDGSGNYSSDYNWHAMLDVSYSVPFNGDIQELTHYTLVPVSFEDEENLLALYVGIASLGFKSGSQPDLGAKNPLMLESGLIFRRLLTSPRSAISPYVTANVGYQRLMWDYRNPVVAGGDTIKSDSLDAVQANVGFGIATRPESRFSLFAEVDAGGTVFLGPTIQGFDNDVFDNYGFFTIRAGLSVGF